MHIVVCQLIPPGWQPLCTGLCDDVCAGRSTVLDSLQPLPRESDTAQIGDVNVLQISGFPRLHNSAAKEPKPPLKKNRNRVLGSTEQQAQKLGPRKGCLGTLLGLHCRCPCCCTGWGHAWKLEHSGSCLQGSVCCQLTVDSCAKDMQQCTSTHGISPLLKATSPTTAVLDSPHTSAAHLHADLLRQLRAE